MISLISRDCDTCVISMNDVGSLGGANFIVRCVREVSLYTASYTGARGHCSVFRARERRRGGEWGDFCDAFLKIDFSLVDFLHANWLRQLLALFPIGAIIS